MKPKPLHVAMLSDYETLGGAAVAASRLADGLACHHRVTRCVLHPDGNEHAWHTWPLIPGRPEHASRWSRFFRDGQPPRSPAALLRQALDKLQPDIVNVHNLHSGTFNGWSADLVAICAEYAPVVWTLHDMWSFTGRCAYSYDCSLFRTGCDSRCPTSHEYPALPLSDIAPAWQHRRDLLGNHPNLVAVTPSQWLARQAGAGLWANHRIEVIPYGLPLEIFRPVPRDQARQLLGIPARGPVLLLAAHDLTERRKGGPMIPHLWDHVPHRPVTLLTMGQGEIAMKDPHIHHVPLGWVDDVHRQAQIYSAADAIIHAAPVDNLPNVLLEAQACGTPAIAFAIGGVPEIIHLDQTGWLASEASPESLGRTIAHALDRLQAGQDLRSHCRAHAELAYSCEAQARRYCDLFASLVPAKKRRWALLARS